METTKLFRLWTKPLFTRLQVLLGQNVQSLSDWVCRCVTDSCTGRAGQNGFEFTSFTDCNFIFCKNEGKYSQIVTSQGSRWNISWTRLCALRFSGHIRQRSWETETQLIFNVADCVKRCLCPMVSAQELVNVLKMPWTKHWPMKINMGGCPLVFGKITSSTSQ